MTDNFPDTPEVKTNKNLLDRDKCEIKGKEYSLVVGQIVKLLSNGEQPRLCVLADPGHGKTYLLGRLSEILHDELDILEGSFDPENQITQDPEKFVKLSRTEKQKILVVPDADSVFPSDEHYTAKNKANKDVIYLTRRNANVLAYDAHELSKCDKGIRTNHNIRLVSVGNAGNYTFDASYITRQNDSRTENIMKNTKGVWNFDKPKKNIQDRIEKLDAEEKASKLEKREEEIRLEKEKKNMDKLL